MYSVEDIGKKYLHLFYWYQREELSERPLGNTQLIRQKGTTALRDELQLHQFY